MYDRLYCSGCRRVIIGEFNDENTLYVNGVVELVVEDPSGNIYLSVDCHWCHAQTRWGQKMHEFTGLNSSSYWATRGGK